MHKHLQKMMDSMAPGPFRSIIATLDVCVIEVSDSVPPVTPDYLARECKTGNYQP